MNELAKNPNFMGFITFYFLKYQNQFLDSISIIEIENHTNNHWGCGAILDTFTTPLLSLPLPSSHINAMFMYMYI
jgi:hypothetical protein